MLLRNDVFLITGGRGLLGRCVTERLTQSGFRVIALGRDELDVTDERAVMSAVVQHQPRAVINCSATTDVDRCEREPDWAYAVNERGPRNLARACRESGAEFVHVSTDYVFDGTKQGYYDQDDEPNPQSVYAKSKLAGEIVVRRELERSYVLRTSWLFGAGGKNFGSRVVDLARAGVRLKGVTDQTSIPTYAPDMAARIEAILQRGRYGLYHVTSSGVTSWYHFARTALDAAGLVSVDVAPCTRADLNQPAPRPANSAMRCLLSPEVGLAPLRDWRDTLAEFLGRLETPASTAV